jgi:hypothetical protein
VKTSQTSFQANVYRYGRIIEELRQDDPDRLKRATALLSWIACADRPLKTYEVLDGVVLCKDPYQLKESTKLTSQVLNRCKPLIEIDASGNVSFVHFTVKEYDLFPIFHALHWLADFRLDIFSINRVDLSCSVSRHYMMFQWAVSHM